MASHHHADEARQVVHEAWRVLVPGGLLGLVSLTHGVGPLSQAVQLAWESVHRLRPRLVGGCRPIRLLDLLGPEWELVCREVVCRFGLCSEVVVASKPESC